EAVALGRAEVDFTDVARLRERVYAVRPAVIVNAVAYNLVDRAETEPEAALRVNSEAVAALGECARELGGALIHYSTDFVFDGKKGGPYTEEDEPRPLGAYGRSK